jgi:dTDP-glucose 4,6-dehydratase
MEFKNILITGGCGFIGSNFINYMIPKYPNTNFINIDKLDYCSNLSNIIVENMKNYKFIKGDLLNMDLLNSIVNDNSIDCIIHMAAQSHVDNSFNNANIFIQDNIIASVNVLELCRNNKTIKRLIHVSTDEVYGEIGINDDNCTVNMKLNPTNPYSASKASAEYFVKCYQKCYNIPVIITRGNNVYGIRQYPEKLIPKFIKLLLENKKCTIHGNGKNLRSFIHVDDTVKAFETIIIKGKIGEIYNIGTECEYSVIDIAKKLIYIIKNTDNYNDWIEYIEDRHWNDLRYGVNNKKLINLGWTESKIYFDDTLKECVEWYKNKFSKKIINNIDTNIEYIMGELEVITTNGKPGMLVPLCTKDMSIKLKLKEEFILNRLFYITNDTDDKNETRGNHANMYIREIIICMSGSCDVKLFNGNTWIKYTLNKNNYIYVGEYIWIEYGNFKNNCILMVLIQDIKKNILNISNISDKICNFEEYKKIINSLNI